MTGGWVNWLTGKVHMSKLFTNQLPLALHVPIYNLKRVMNTGSA